jgi:hypothetical protein
MLLDTIAVLILAAMMFVPLLNIFVGLVAGAGIAGPPGALCGAACALAITTAQMLLGRRRARA